MSASLNGGGVRLGIAGLLLGVALASGCAARAVPAAATAARVSDGTVPRAECFPVDRLPAHLQAGNDALLLEALDSEALYTILADIKPLSAGFASWRIDLEAPEIVAPNDARRMLATWTCGDALTAGAHHFARVFDNKKSIHAWVARRPRIRALIEERAGFFTPLGVTPHTDVVEVILAVEYAESLTRFRGYGWLFGYPDYAVDFFVEAARSEQATGEFVKRDARSAPVFKRPTNAFVWVRPVGSVDTAADLEIDARARPILDAYRRSRDRYVGDGKRGVVELLRDWLCDSQGRCGGRVAAPADDVSADR